MTIQHLPHIFPLVANALQAVSTKQPERVNSEKTQIMGPGLPYAIALQVPEAKINMALVLPLH